MKTTSLIFLFLAISSAILSAYSSIIDDNHGVVTGLIGIYGNLILYKLHKKD